MDGQNVIVAVYASFVAAERARDRLIEMGIPANDIRMNSEPMDRSGLAETNTAAAPRQEGFWDWLFGRDVPEYDRTWYQTNLREGRTVLSVIVRDLQERRRVADILEDFNPIDFDETANRYRETETPTVTTGIAGVGNRPDSGVIDRPGETLIGSGERREISGTEEQVIPVVKEDVSVGKRVSERRYRIRTYTVETPVERDVSLRDERVVVERRPVSDQSALARTASDMPKDREYEVIERHEEPVVGKRREVEEVVVRKEADERTEKVRDTVRETRVDVDKDTAGPVENVQGAVRKEPIP